MILPPVVMHGMRIGCLAVAAVVGSLGCTHWQKPPPLPVASSVTLEQLVVYSDFELPRDHRLLRQVDALRREISAELRLPMSGEPIHVYLFKTPKRYRAFIDKHYPDFPDRRAFFVETDTRLSVYAYWGDRIAEDLRHEVSHGYLHAMVPNLPLWLDEGLAEYFEVDRSHHGVHSSHLAQLMTAWEDETWRPDLSRLEKQESVHDMKQIDYAEAWAWVHFALHSRVARRERLEAYLEQLREGHHAESLASVLLRQEPDAKAQLVAHLQKLAADRTR